MYIEVPKRFCLHCNNSINEESSRYYCYFCLKSLLNENNCNKQFITRFFKSSIKIGIIKKRNCIHCDSKKSEFHVYDYFRPFDIVWLCNNHHKDYHNWDKDFLESKLC